MEVIKNKSETGCVIVDGDHWAVFELKYNKRGIPQVYIEDWSPSVTCASRSDMRKLAYNALIPVGSAEKVKKVEKRTCQSL